MPVQKTYMTWLDVEKKLEEEYRVGYLGCRE
jgi:hypothetical protein